jgi:hypothetical protein
MNEYPELDDLGIVAPEASDAWESEPWQEPMVEDPVIAPRLRAIGFHRYGDLYEVEDWDNQPVPWWLTEFNAGEGFCYRANWGTGMELAIVLVRGLLSGVKAGMVWTDYDAPHSHSGDAWESFGLLATTLDGVSYLCDAFPEPPSQSELDQMTYEPKPTYYAAKHAFRHIQRGALRRSINEVEGIEWVAFDNPDGSTVVYGLKSNDGDVEVELGDGAPTSMEVYVSTEGDYYREAGEFTLENGSGSVDLPGDSVFTLVGGP